MSINWKSIKRTIQRDSEAGQLVADSGISKTQLQASITGLENWFNSNPVQLAAKQAMQDESQFSISNNLAKKLCKAWMAERIGGM